MDPEQLQQADEELQEKVSDIKEENLSFLAKLEMNTEKKLDLAFNRKLILIAFLGVIFMAAAWVIVWYGFFSKNYDQCINDCELSVTNVLDQRDCSVFCAKYK